MLIDDALRAFRDAVCGAEPEIDLALGALEVARVEHPNLAAAHEQQRLDVLAMRSGGGAVLTPERAAEVVARALGRRAPMTEQHLAPVTKRQILTRMLMNLKSVYTQRREWTKALSVYDRLLILDGSAAAHFRDRGAVYVRLRHFHKGVGDWERYLTRCPKAEDADAVRHQLRQVRQRLAALNGRDQECRLPARGLAGRA